MTDQPAEQQKSARRTPMQQRSQKRVEVILTAAAALIAEVGYEAVTTSAIAERAGTSVGSLYQFFPNKDAILHALAQNYLTDMTAMGARMFPPDVVMLDDTVIIDRTVDWLIEFESSHAGFTPIFNSPYVSPELKAAEDALKNQMVGQIERILAARLPTLNADRRRVCAQIIMTMYKGALPLALAGDDSQRDMAREELKRAVLAYLAALRV